MSRSIKPMLILLIASVVLSACSGTTSLNPTPRPGEDVIPTPVSSLVGTFVWQTDGLFGYRTLRPTNWESMNLIDSRTYGTPGFRAQADRIVLRVVNLQAHYKVGTTPTGLIATLSLFEQAPSLEGWTAGVEQMWKSDGIESTLLRTLPQAKIYAVKSPGSSDIQQIVAYAVDKDQPLSISLTASGAYADQEFLQREGILDDFAAMVASIQAIPQDPQNVAPLLK